MTDNDKFERFLRRALQKEYQPPPLRRHSLWARITSALWSARARASHRRRYVFVAVRVAAAVVTLGGTGLILLRRSSLFDRTTRQAVSAGRVEDREPFLRVAAEHFAEVRTLLANSSGPIGPDKRRLALRLLVRTRLLSQSPRLDTNTVRLLGDIEPVLIIIQTLSDGNEPDPFNRELLAESIAREQLLARLERSSRLRTVRVAS